MGQKTKLIIGFLITFVLLACIGVFRYFSQKELSSNFQDQLMLREDKESCEAKGGQWGKIGIRPKEECNLPTLDSGKECTGSEDCEGLCLADLSQEEWQNVRRGFAIESKGKCASWKITVGCHPFVQDGKVESIICVD